MVAMAVAVTTAPRPIPTLRASIDSFRAAGFRYPVQVSVDGTASDHADAMAAMKGDPDWSVVSHGSRVGVPRHWLRTLETLLATTAAPRVLMLQDDCIWAPGSAAAVERVADRLAPFWTFYADRLVTREIEEQQAHYNVRMVRRLAPGAYWSSMGHQSGCALAYGFDREFAQKLVACPAFLYDVDNHERGIDRWVPAAGLRFDQPLQVWIPSLVTHELGSGNSAMRLKAPRDTPYPAGDASELWR
jgi:hypothetical protein